MRTEAPSFASRRASAMASLSELKRRRASRPSVGLKATIQPPFSRKFHFAHTRKVLTIDTVLPLPFASGTFREEHSGFSLATAGLVAIPAGQQYVDWAPRIHPSRPRRWACGMGGRSFLRFTGTLAIPFTARARECGIGPCLQCRSATPIAFRKFAPRRLSLPGATGRPRNRTLVHLASRSFGRAKCAP